MRYLGKAIEVEVATKRKVEYVRCDKCSKKIVARELFKHQEEEYSYFKIHTSHSDWGNDSVDSHEYYDFCKDCAKDFVCEYIKNANGTEELELERLVLGKNETTRETPSAFSGLRLVEDDKE